MTPQEQQMLADLTTRINRTQLTEKDPEAEQFLNQKLSRNPDALYIMAQTALVQGYALEQALKQLAETRAQLQQAQQQPKHATSFLGGLFGSNDDPKPAPAQYQPVTSNPPSGSYYAQQSNFPPAPQYAPPYGAPQYVPSQGGAFQQGGFLRSAMTTATGVAAGALAFEGIESLMHGFGGHPGGQGFGDFGGGGAPREEIVNNYYGDSSSGEHHEPGRDFAANDVEDRRNDSQNIVDTDQNDSSDSYDAGSSDDGGSFDPGGNDSSF